MTTSTGKQVRIVAERSSGPSLVQRMRRSRFLMAVLSPLLILLVWEVLVRLHILDARFFPTPSSIIEELFVLLQGRAIYVNIGWTLQRVVIGFVLGAVPGIVLGVLLGLSPTLRDFLQPAISALYPVPKIALFPLIMIIFGVGEASKWVIVAVAVFFQVFYSTLAGVVNIDRIYLDVTSNFKASRWQTWKTIAFPGALPFIFTGCQLGFGMAGAAYDPYKIEPGGFPAGLRVSGPHPAPAERRPAMEARRIGLGGRPGKISACSCIVLMANLIYELLRTRGRAP